jgi:hypothetical protein
MKEGEVKTETKTILFGEGLLVPTLISERQTSLRKYREEAHNLHKGEIFVGSFKDGLDILLQATADTEIKTFKELTDLEAQADGFIDAKDVFVGMHKYYPDLTPDTKFGILHFKIAIINGVPSVKANNNRSLYDIKVLEHDAQLYNLF